MLNRGNTTIGVAMLSLALFACADSTTGGDGACGDGEAVAAGGSSFCVYRQNIVIVGGFDCPAGMPYRMDFRGATVCGSSSFEGIDVPEDVCARVFVPCLPPDDSDASVPVAPLRCGGSVCERPHASTMCLNGSACVIDTCDEGFGDCNGNTADGCETSLDTLSNCGACGRTCSNPNATASCNAGVCELVACDAGFGDCDADPNNGCETRLNTQQNCGSCGMVCGFACTEATGEPICIDSIE